MKKTFKWLFVFLFMMSCSDKKENSDDFTQNEYVQEYLDNSFVEGYSKDIKSVSFICFGYRNKTSGYFNWVDCDTIVSKHAGFKVLLMSEICYTIAHPEFYEYRDLLNDTYYHGGWHTILMADTISKIDIVCNEDFDAEHPAGTSLNDVFSVFVDDPYSYIKNGYKHPSGKDFYVYGDDINSVAWGGVLSELAFEEHPFLESDYMFNLNKSPEKSGTYRFYVTFYDVNGKSWSTDIPEMYLIE